MHMYACMYVCVYVCMHVCMYVCMYACMYICVYIYIYIYIYTYSSPPSKGQVRRSCGREGRANSSTTLLQIMFADFSNEQRRFLKMSRAKRLI